MNRIFTSLLALTAIAVTLAAATTDASAQWRGRGWGGGWRGPGPGVAAGVVAGAVVAGAIIASRPAGYVVYPGYAQPLYGPSCYWAAQPVLDPFGHVVGYTGQPVQVCPGYAGPPPAGPIVAAPPGPVVPAPGPVAGPPVAVAPGPVAAGPPPGYVAGGPPDGDPAAYCAQRFRSYDPRSGTYLGNDGQRHPCP
jgi:hypothetical protein